MITKQMNKENLNVVFMPISIFKGMAGTKRLNNYLKTFDKNKIRYHAINISPDAKDLENIEMGLSYSGGFQRFWIQFKALSLLCKLKIKDRKNILYFYDTPSIKNVHLLIFAKLIGYKVIIDIVENYDSVRDFKNKISKIKYKTSSFFLEKIRFYVDGIIVISSCLENIMTLYSKGKLPLLTIPITIDVSEYENVIANTDSESEIKIFYGGSFGQKDGLSYLLNAFDKVCDLGYSCRLFISGKGSTKNMVAFSSELQNIKHQKRVSSLGYLEREEYVKHLMQADIHCMTRVNSSFANAGFPFKLGEMLSSGKPVICTNVGDVKHYLIHDESALIIEPNSVNALVDAILRLILDRNLCYKIGNKGKNVAYRYFDSVKISNRLIDFCCNI